MRILSSEAMAGVDRRAIEEIGVPSLVLMENAAIGLADAVGARFPDVASVVIFCGPGNNGGDGLALARQLASRGVRAESVLVFEGRDPSSDTAAQLAMVRALELPVLELGPDDPLDAAVARAGRCDLVVDALFGTGLSRPLEGRYAALVEGLGALAVPRLAVDLPSGLAGSRTDVFGPHLVADLTVTFGAPKPAQILGAARRAVGELAVAGLGIPRWLIEEAPEPGEEAEDEDVEDAEKHPRGGTGELGVDPHRPAAAGRLHLIVTEELAALLPPREPDTHKGTYGHLLLVAGSVGAAGAAILAARGAVRSGAGLVTAAVPEPLASAVDSGSVESMTRPMAASDAGTLAGEALDDLRTAVAERDALAVGPGLGVGLESDDPADDPVAALVRRLVLETTVPAVLDADAVVAFAGDGRHRLAERDAPTVLTPHPGEMGRLLGVETAAVTGDRFAAARRAARDTGAVVVLKGHRTLVATPDGAVHVHTHGNPGMATGGSGDVLTGLVGGLLARGFGALEAALLGVHLHGLAGDGAAAARGEEALAAGDLVEWLGEAFRHLTGDGMGDRHHDSGGRRRD